MSCCPTCLGCGGVWGTGDLAYLVVRCPDCSDMTKASKITNDPKAVRAIAEKVIEAARLGEQWAIELLGERIIEAYKRGGWHAPSAIPVDVD
jgi:hypothetical protein